MATTTRGIVYPTTSTTLTPLSNHFASLATSADTAIGTLETKTGSFRGLDSARPTAGVEGRSWYSTDTDRQWFDTGTNWISQDIGMYLIRPTGVTGGTFNSEGAFIPDGSATAYRFGGVFTTRFRAYRIVYYRKTSTNNADLFRLRASSVDYASSTYTWYSMEGTGSGNAISAAGNGVTSWALNAGTASNVWGTIDLYNPAHAGTDMLKTYQSNFTGTTFAAVNVATRGGYISGIDSNSYDGFSIITSPSGAWSSGASWLKIYGIA